MAKPHKIWIAIIVGKTMSAKVSPSPTLVPVRDSQSRRIAAVPMSVQSAIASCPGIIWRKLSRKLSMT